MLEYLQFLLPYVVEFKYIAVFGALVGAGFGIPIPEEATLVLSGYMVSIGQMNLGITLLVCYLGVLGGDIVTYFMGRYGGRWVLGTRLFRLIISRKQLSQAQYYYRRYGPRSLLLARQMPGVRFPAFFSAGLLKVSFWRFLLFDAFAAMVSMPVVFFIAYYFGHRIGDALSMVRRLGDITTIGLGGLAVIGLIAFFVYRRWFRTDPTSKKLRN